MKRNKKLLAIGIIATVIVSTSITAFATSSYPSLAEIAAELTGRTTEDVIEERAENQKSYGMIANEAGKFSEFQEKRTELKKDKINAQVESRKITQEEADNLLKALIEKQKNCDGMGQEKLHQNVKERFGSKQSGFGNQHKKKNHGKIYRERKNGLGS